MKQQGNRSKCPLVAISFHVVNTYYFRLCNLRKDLDLDILEKIFISHNRPWGKLIAFSIENKMFSREFASGPGMTNHGYDNFHHVETWVAWCCYHLFHKQVWRFSHFTWKHVVVRLTWATQKLMHVILLAFLACCAPCQKRQTLAGSDIHACTHTYTHVKTYTCTHVHMHASSPV